MSKLSKTVLALDARFSDYWGEEIPAQGDDETWYNKSGDYEQPDNEAWVHFSILFGDSNNRKNCGGNMVARRNGTVQLWIYVPSEQGVYEASQIADKFIPIFENFNSEIHLTSASFLNSGKRSNWNVWRVTIPFDFDDKT